MRGGLEMQAWFANAATITIASRPVAHSLHLLGHYLHIGCERI